MSKQLKVSGAASGLPQIESLQGRKFYEIYWVYTGIYKEGRKKQEEQMMRKETNKQKKQDP